MRSNKRSNRSILKGGVLLVTSLAMVLPTISAQDQAKEIVDLSPRKIWQAFVKHVETLGKKDQLPKAEGSNEVAPLDLGKGDPIPKILMKISPEFIRLDAQFQKDDNPFAKEPEDPEKAKKDRMTKIRKESGALLKSNDPYLKAYATLYSARADIEEGKYKDAQKKLESLNESRYFLSGPETHRYLAEIFRAQKEDTLAILELQLYLVELGDDQVDEKRWVSEQLKEIRDSGHKGPLKDTLNKAEEASRLIKELKVESENVDSEDDQTAEEAAEKQREVEDILHKTLSLLLGESNSSPQQAQASQSQSQSQSSSSSQQQQQSQSQRNRQGQRREGQQQARQGNRQGQQQGQPKAGQGQQRQGQGQGKQGRGKSRLEQVLEKTIQVLEKNGQKKNGKGKGQKPGQKPGEGDPQQSQQPNEPAKDTKIKDDPYAGKINRRKGADDNEAWGKINNREVARSLRELWGKIPIPYRGMVSQYFKDITDLAPEKK